jgi:DNA-binding response OmpR family regulator
MSDNSMSKPKVLIVEDDDDLRRGLTWRLHASGYQIVQATDGVAAVSVAKHERPDVVLLDLGLPAGDGLTVLERYANLPDLSAIPVVVLTGRDPRTAAPATRKFHVAAFLQKPADNKDLVAAIERALRGETTLPDTPDTPDTPDAPAIPPFFC